MVRLKTMLIIIVLLLFYPMLAIAENDKPAMISAEIWKDMMSYGVTKDSCSMIGGYWIPEKLWDTLNKDTLKDNPDGTVTIFWEKSIFDITFAYHVDIDNKLKRAAEPNNKYAYGDLDCAKKLGESEEKVVFDWYYSPPGIEVASAREPLYHMFLELLCTQYNKIALQYERENMPDKAEDIYRNILRNFDWTKGCFKEAEIGLQNLRSKAAK